MASVISNFQNVMRQPATNVRGWGALGLSEEERWREQLLRDRMSLQGVAFSGEEAARLREWWQQRQDEGELARSTVANEPLDSGYSPAPPPSGPSQEYREKLKAIGAAALLAKVDADAECARFIDEVKSRGLRFYKQSNVEQYLIAEARKAKPGTYGVSWTPVEKYTQAIPLPVVETMLWVKQEFPAAAFSISEVKRYPDPFLMVTLHGQRYIIEKWDEPSYREE